MENSTRTYLTNAVTQQEELMYTGLTDTTQYYEGDEPLHPSRIISMIISSVAFLLGTTGNGIVIFFTAFKMKRSVNVVWFLNLAIADFIFTLFLPLFIAHIALDFHWPLQTFMCKLNTLILYINLYTSIFLLTVISIDRCTSVVFPVWCQNHRTPRMASFVALVVWVLAFMFSLPYFIFRDTEDNDGYVTCLYNFAKDPHVNELIHRGTVIIRVIFGFIIPFSLIVLCYTIIILRIQRNHMYTSGKPFKIIVAVIISFFICWFPFHVFSFLELAAMYSGHGHLGKALNSGIPLSYSLAFINSCINPFLYVFMGRDFKTRLRRSLQSVLEKAFMEETVQTSYRSKTTDSQAL